MAAVFDQVRAAVEANAVLSLTVAIAMLLLLAVASHYLVKYVMRRIARAAAPRLGPVIGEYAKDDVLFGRLAQFMPALIFYQGIVLVPGISERAGMVMQKLAVVAAIFIGIRIVTRLMNKGNEIYIRYPIARTRPIKGLIQVASLILYVLGFILVIATVMNESPLVLLSGLGAMTAILLLVFRDTILSLVAGVQLTTNDLIRVGDWIEMPQFGADGDVVDIALHVVKVQNWDKTLTMIPTHKFLENSFRNWRGMSESGGRRIKRSVAVDVNTIRFLTDEEIDRFGTYALLKDYIAEKRADLAAFNRERVGDGVLVANARRLTNVGTFRAYLINYLRQHPGINQNMTFLVRQLQPTAEGLPIEIYVFTNDVRWAFYEGTQADVFDHLFAVVGEFGLRLYQKPSGQDVRDGVPALAAKATT